MDAIHYRLHVMQVVEAKIAAGRCADAARLAYDKLGPSAGDSTTQRCPTPP